MNDVRYTSEAFQEAHREELLRAGFSPELSRRVKTFMGRGEWDRLLRKAVRDMRDQAIDRASLQLRWFGSFITGAPTQLRPEPFAADQYRRLRRRAEKPGIKGEAMAVLLSIDAAARAYQRLSEDGQLSESA